MSALVRAFRAEAGPAPPDRDGARLDQLLAALYARGREANPRVVVSEPAFGRYLARCSNGGKAVALSGVAPEDLYLACACAERVRGASAVFDRRFGGVIRRAVSRVLSTPDERQEAEQRAWQHLLVGGEGGPPRIGQYLGQGSLEEWISVASMRIAISLGRAESAERRLREKAIAEVSGVDPEQLFMKAELRGAFEAAVTAALGRLKPRERLVLKLFLVSGMTLEAIGKCLGVTRQAVAKTLSRGRESIVAEVEASVCHSLKISKDDLSSILRFVASQLDVSISRVLAKS